MTQDELLQLAWGAAWSAPNNKQPSGTYIGTISRGGRDYEFYEVALFLLGGCKRPIYNKSYIKRKELTVNTRISECAFPVK